MLRFLLVLLSIITLLFVVQLARLQIFTDKYRLNGFSTSIKKEFQIPQRGYILDRYGKMIVASMPTYDITYTKVRMSERFDTLGFCRTVKITKSDFVQKIKEIESDKTKFNALEPAIFYKGLTQEEVAAIEETFFKYEGFEIVKRSERQYLTDGLGNVLGYTSEVNKKEIEKEPEYYVQSDYIGKAGVEKSYEKILRGHKGIQYIQKDKRQRSIGKYKDGKYDEELKGGTDITLTIDLELQEYAEKLLTNKRGAVVAIDPKNGEILVLASSPNYSPSLLTGKFKQQNLNFYLKDSMQKPMFDRATQSMYPPGSTFKLVNALAEMQMGVIDTSTAFSCHGGSYFGGRRVKCHDYGTFKLETAIQNSCNSYFSKSYLKAMKYDSTDIDNSIDKWYEIMTSFGLNNYFHNDLASGTTGLIPNSEYYNRNWGSGKWNGYSILSNGIGQGEILCTPLQMANYTAAIANQGFYFTPHIVKKIGGKPITDTFYTKPKYTLVEKKHFKHVIEGMKRVVTRGTGRRIQTKLFTQAGKTGTSQVPHGQHDHSIFVMFAPVDNPKIAVAVVIENGGSGASIAAPTATLVAEKYLLGEVSRAPMEKSVIARNIMPEYRRNYINEMKKKGWYKPPRLSKEDSIRIDSLKKWELKKREEDQEKKKSEEEDKKKSEFERINAILREEGRKKKTADTAQ
ncbi:MAG: penicillin-binding protein 2 [Chryseobacterium sp.]|nr:MAG: penicillin-binding protein 2 [Chryseobacterium sp.]